MTPETRELPVRLYEAVRSAPARGHPADARGARGARGPGAPGDHHRRASMGQARGV